MTELVHITAQYSNAVLVAIMPYIGDFAQRLNLPLQNPITMRQVAQFKCDPRKDHVGGVITLTNNFEFTFLDGRVCVYRSPDSYFSLQDIDPPARFYGPIKLSEREAVDLARQAIQKLGYTETATHTKEKPQVTAPVRHGNTFVPRYRMTWLDPSWSRISSNPGIMPAIMDIEVNAENGRIEMFSMGSRETQAPNPRVAVTPTLIQPQRTRSNLLEAGPTSWANKQYASALLTNVLPLISDFAQSARLRVKVPLTLNDIDQTRYTCVIEQGSPVVQVFLQNGDRFNFMHGHVVGFYAHDAFFKFPKMGRVDDFLGKINFGTNDAIVLSKEVLHRLGYEATLHMAIGAPANITAENFTRYFIRYSRDDNNSLVSNFEIDLGDNSIKAIYLDDPILWREPPSIAVPMSTTTNAPSRP